MCGRFALFATENEIVSHFRLQRGFSMRPRYNIAPSQTIPIILKEAKQIDFCRWGFIPSWHKAQATSLPAGYINARLESITEKPTFRFAFQQQRCLIPVSGYYEWRNLLGKKQPYFVHSTNHPLIAVAGLWSSWQSPQGISMLTCAIVTTQATSALQQLHERMPVILSPKDYATWLADETNPQILKDICHFSWCKDLKFYPVSWRMNSPHFEGMECVKAI